MNRNSPQKYMKNALCNYIFVVKFISEINHENCFTITFIGFTLTGLVDFLNFYSI